MSAKSVWELNQTNRLELERNQRAPARRGAGLLHASFRRAVAGGLHRDRRPDFRSQSRCRTRSRTDPERCRLSGRRRRCNRCLQHADKPAAGITAAVVGFITLLFGASGVFGELRDSLNAVWGVKSTSGAGTDGDD